MKKSESLRRKENDLQHECKITVIDKKCFTDYQEQYLADPKSGPCPFFNVGDEFILKRTPQQDDFYHLMTASSAARHGMPSAGMSTLPFRAALS